MRNPLSGLTACLLVAATSALVPDAAHGAPCAGFSDVDDTSAFCRNVEWMKNRAITTGCTASSYCPDQVVARISMAAFLRRLGDALTPVDRRNVALGQVVDIDAAPVLCQTSDYSVTGGPRTIHGHAALVVHPGASAADITLEYVESTDGGASWSAVSSRQMATVASGRGPTINVLLPPRDAVAGTTYRHGLRVGRVAGSATTGDIGAYQCSVRVRFENRNPATAPFDVDS